MSQSSSNAHLSSAELMQMESDYAAHNYHPVPVVFDKAQGVLVWDPEGNQYFDFLSAYSAVNQGHCHPEILAALVKQASACTLSSRAFYNSVFPQFAKMVTQLLGFDMVLPMNTGAEAVETGLKLARKWAYTKKGVPKNQAKIICCDGCFHGRTIGIVSMSNDPSAYEGYGPLLDGFIRIPYNDHAALAKVLEEEGDSIAAFLVEPIQGEAGVLIPDDGYLKACYDSCKKHNVLFIADEIQTGLGRTGKWLACDWEGFKPDLVLLGKALSGGVLPVSAVLTSKEVMLTIKPGEHGSTYGGNPLSSAVAMASLEVLQKEHLVDNAQVLGTSLLGFLQKMKAKYPFITTVRGRGLFCAIDIDQSYPKTAYELCILFKQNGLLAKPTHEHIIRLAPPLVLSPEQLVSCQAIIEKSLAEFASQPVEQAQKL